MNMNNLRLTWINWHWKRINAVKYLSSKIIFVHNFTLKITSARAWIRARLNKGPVVSLVEKNKGPGYKTSKYGNSCRYWQDKTEHELIKTTLISSVSHLNLGVEARDERTDKFFSPSPILIRKNLIQSSPDPQNFWKSSVRSSPDPPIWNHVFCLMR